MENSVTKAEEEPTEMTSSSSSPLLGAGGDPGTKEPTEGEEVLTDGNIAISMSSGGLRPRYSTYADLVRARESMKETVCSSKKGKVHKSVNMRDVGRPEATQNLMKPNIFFRSSQIICGDDLESHGIRTVLDLRVPPPQCKANAHNQMQRLNRWLTRIIVFIRRFLLRKKERLQRNMTKLVVDEDTLEEYPRCIRCSRQSDTLYGVSSKLNVHHIDLLPNFAQYWIFYELPLYLKAKILWMKIKGEDPESMVAAAVADDKVLGFVKLYKIILTGSKRRIARAFRLFLQHECNLPAIVHCIHGKDRTGIFVMIVYLLCDVPREDIIKDYALSETLLIQGRENHELEDIPEPLTTNAIMASSEYVMEATLNFVEQEYGGVHEYLNLGGMTDDEIEALRAIFKARAVQVD